MTALRLCLLAVAAALASGSPLTRTCAKQASDFDTFLKIEHTRGVPFAAASSFNPCAWATATAINLLAAPLDASVILPETIVLTLGILGKVDSNEKGDAYASLINFLQDDTGSEDGILRYSVYMGKSNVPVALGCLLNQIDLDLHSDREARINSDLSTEALRAKRSTVLQYLVDGLTDSHIWQSRLKWRSSYDATPADRNAYFAMKTVQGLAISGDPSAGCILEWTEKHLSDPAKYRTPPKCEGVDIRLDTAHWGREALKKADREQMLQLVRDALKTNREVNSYPNGLLGYYNKNEAASFAGYRRDK